MFNIGAYVVTKSNGICKVTGKEQNGSGDTIYTVEPWNEKETVVRVPFESGELVRGIINKDEAEELVDRIPYITTLKIPKKNMSEAIFTSAMEQWDVIEWVRVLKTVYLAEKEKRLSDSEKSMADTAKQYLHSELALALNISFAEVEPYIQASVKNNF